MISTKEYFEQIFTLRGRLSLDLADLAAIEALSTAPSTSSLEPRYNPNRRTEASFVPTLERLKNAQAKVAADKALLQNLEKQAEETIEAVQYPRYRLVLLHHYIYGKTWVQIADALNVNERTVRRWHDDALAVVTLPPNPILIGKELSNTK